MSSCNKDLYIVLGLTRNCTREDVKKRFYRLSRSLHPDRNVCLSAEKQVARAKLYQDVLLAHSILVDPELREEYDMLSAKDKSFLELKSEAKVEKQKLNLHELAVQHKAEIDARHADLLKSFKARNTKEYESESESKTVLQRVKRTDLMLPVRKSKVSKEVTIVPSTETLTSTKYQIVTKVGEMYWSGEEDPLLRDYTLDVTRKDVKEAKEVENLMPKFDERIRMEKLNRHELSGAVKYFPTF